jgi:hypothetical protein
MLCILCIPVLITHHVVFAFHAYVVLCCKRRLLQLASYFLIYLCSSPSTGHDHVLPLTDLMAFTLDDEFSETSKSMVLCHRNVCSFVPFIHWIVEFLALHLGSLVELRLS